MLVNRQPVAQATYGRTATEYSYVAGDAVDVSCYTKEQICALALYYHYVDNRLTGDGAASESIKSRYSIFDGVGIRLRLREPHHGSRVTCACSAEPLAAIAITLTFIQLNNSNDLDYLEMNGLSLRPHNPADRSIYRVYYLSGERFTFTPRPDPHQVLVSRYDPLHLATLPRPLNTSYIYVEPSTEGCLTFDVTNKTTSTPLRHVIINFVLLSYSLVDMWPLILNVSEVNVLMKLYQWTGDQRVYYEFTEGELLVAKCNCSVDDAHNMTDHQLQFGEAGPTHRNNIIKSIRLKPTDDKAELFCSLRSRTSQNNFTETKFIHILFRLKPRTLPGVGAGQRGWWVWCSLGAALCLVLVLMLCAGVYHLIKQKREASVLKHDNCEDTRITRAAVTMRAGRRHEAVVYSEVQRPRAGAALLAPDDHGDAHELNYAVLDIAIPSNKPVRLVNSSLEESPYAEVCLNVNANLSSEFGY